MALVLSGVFRDSSGDVGVTYLQVVRAVQGDVGELPHEGRLFLV